MQIFGLDQIHIVDETKTDEDIMKDIVRTDILKDPFYIFDVSNLVDKIRIWQQLLPRLHPFYSVKCNDNTILLEILAAVGVNFDCNSRSDINQILNLGVDPSRILFNNTMKQPAHIKFAMTKYVNLTTFDNEIELYKLKSTYPTCNLLIQICYDSSVTEYSTDMKRGCDPYVRAPELLLIARDLELSVVGVSFHIGSKFTEPEVLQRAIYTSAMIFQTAEELGFKNMYLLNIGGGFSVNESISLSNMADILNNSLDECFPEENDITILADPGIFITTSAFTLATRINSVSRSTINDGHIKYFINDGIDGSFKIIHYDGLMSVVPKPLKNYPTRTVYQSSIWGPDTDRENKLVDSVELPLMHIDEWITFKDMGAYTISSLNTYNISPFPNVYAIANHTVWECLKDIMPITEEHFTTVPIVAVIKMIQSSLNHREASRENEAFIENDENNENNE